MSQFFTTLNLRESKRTNEKLDYFILFKFILRKNFQLNTFEVFKRRSRNLCRSVELFKRTSFSSEVRSDGSFVTLNTSYVAIHVEIRLQEHLYMYIYEIQVCCNLSVSAAMWNIHTYIPQYNQWIEWFYICTNWTKQKAREHSPCYTHGIYWKFWSSWCFLHAICCSIFK